MNKREFFHPGDKVGILHNGIDTGKRGIVREVTGDGLLIVDPEPGEDDNGHPYCDDEGLFFHYFT